MRRLLTHLAQFSSFARQGELLCTQSLAHFLQDADARAAFSAFVSQRMGMDVPSELEWRAEVRQDDLGRPDLEGRTGDGAGLVKVEAKLSAALGSGQLRSYVNDLNARCQQGVLLVLVPRRRAGEAAKVVSEAFNVSGEGPWQIAGTSLCGVAVIAWEEVLEALRTVRTQPFQSDLEQFEAMFKGLNGDVIEPFETAEELQDPEREEKLVKLVDRVTRLLAVDGRVMPMGDDQDGNKVAYRRRYICPPLLDERPCFSVGVRHPFAGYKTPIWLRFNRTTPKFTLIRDRLTAASPTSDRMVESGGHVWIPIDVPIQTEGGVLIESLLDQIRRVIQVAYES